MKNTKETKENKVEENTYRIIASRYNQFESKIKRFQKRAIKLGLDEIQIKKTGEEIIKVNTSTGKYPVKVINITITGINPVIAGWKFIGRLEHNRNDKVIIFHSTKDTQIPCKFVNAKPICEHCHKDWIFRKDTFIIQNESGEYKQVGRTCLNDFIENENAYDVAKLFEQVIEYIDDFGEMDDEEMFSGGKYIEHVYIKECLEKAIVLINKYGFTSKSNASFDKESTADLVISWLFHPLDFKDLSCKIDVNVIKEVEDAIDWTKNINISYKDNTFNEYLYNIKTLVNSSDIVNIKNIGYIASIISTYRKDIAKKFEAEQNRNSSNYLGNVGDKISVENVALIFVKPFETQYGTTYLYKFIKDEFTFVWFSSNDKNISIGEIFNLSGTVKKHDEYNGEKQTIVTRCKIKNIKGE